MLKNLINNIVKVCTKDLFAREITLESDAPFDPFEAHLSCTLDGPHVQPLQTVIPKSAHMTGTLSSPHPIRIDGHFEGTLQCDEITIGKTATVKSDLSLMRASISGQVFGNLLINGHLTLTATAKIHGNITADSISMEEGAHVTESISITSAPSLATAL